MEKPILYIIWICVAVFVATAVVSILYLIGKIPKMDPVYGKRLVTSLIFEVVTACLLVFGAYVKSAITSFSHPALPATDVMVSENGSTIKLLDDDRTIYVWSTNVNRDQRFAVVRFGVRSDLTDFTEIAHLNPSEPITVSVAGRDYRVAYTKIGSIDPDPAIKQSAPIDFIFLSVERAVK